MNMPSAQLRPAGSLACLACIFIALSGCATWTAPTDTGDTQLRGRAVTKAERGVEVSATVLGRHDCIRMLGSDVTAAGVQPVWIEVRNDTEHILWLLRAGADPDYFSPLEVAWSAHVTLASETNARMDEHFSQLAFPNPIPARSTSSGILFTNPQPVTKLLTVDLLGSKMMIPFTLFLPVPGAASANEVIHQYAATEIADYGDLGALREALTDLPCCGATADGRPVGEPLNVVFIGNLDDIAAAVNRRGYRRDQSGADPSLLVFGRPADLTLRKRVKARASASWLHIWRAPLSYRGDMVFVAQAARPIGGRFLEGATQDLRLHADVDEVRNQLIQDFMYSGGLENLAFVSGVGAAPVDRPRTLPGGSSYFTDGRRVALFLSTRPRTFAEVEILQWEPILPAPSAEAAKDASDAGN
jgi:LssY C-terminus